MKIIGLDLGVTTIGWAYTQEFEHDFEILGMGTRVVPYNLSNTQELNDFAKGKAYSTSQSRRIKRGARKNFARYDLRRKLLSAKLKSLDMLPQAEMFGLSASDIYGLRSKGVSEKISLKEIGRVFLHLNQRRGYKSSRKTGQNEKSDYLNAIRDLEKTIAQENLTIGQYFYAKIANNEHFRTKEKIFTRASYIAEFNKIWETQAQFYPEILTFENLKVIRDEIIYFQRPLKSQKSTVANCRFEVHHKTSPKSSPLFQWFKSWQLINNLKIEDKKGNQRVISLVEKNIIFELLENNAKVTDKKILKALAVSDREFSLNFKDLQGNLTRVKLLEALSNRPDLLSFSPKITGTTDGEEILQSVDGKDNKDLRFYQLWHVLHSIDEPEAIVKTLTKAPFLFDEEGAKKLSEISFQQGFGNVSSRAMRKLLPKLMAGLNYADACKAMGYNHSDSKTREENEARILVDRLPLLKKGELRNPIVEKIINQTINLVNKLIETYGRPDEIRVELARSLKDNAERRADAEKKMAENKKFNDLCEKEIKDTMKWSRVSKKDIIKYKLWKEFGGVSPYEPEHPIKIEALFSGEYDVEHIVPKARLFDDSFANKTIARNDLNRLKDAQTAMDFMMSLNAEKQEAYKNFVLKTFNEKKISKAKRDRLLMTADEIPEDFIARQLQETRYITRTVKTLLQDVCRNVTSTTGSVTDYLRHEWGLDDVLQQLNWHKYEALGLVTTQTDENGRVKKQIKDWTKRDDHRNHAVDALVVACSKQAYIQQLNKLNQQFDHYRDLKESGRKFKKPVEHLTEVVKDATDNILVSFKAGKKVGSWKKDKLTGTRTLVPRGPLHEETIYGKNNEGKYTIRYNINQDFDKVDKIIDPQVKKLVLGRLAAFDNDPKKAFKDLETNPLYFNAEKNIKITAVKCYARLENAEVLKTDAEGKILGYVKLGNNHHVALYRNEQGKLVEEVVTFWEAIERKREGLNIINRTPTDGRRFVVSMQINEMFVFGLSLDELQDAIEKSSNKLISKHLYRVQKLTNGDYFFRNHVETSVSDESSVAKSLSKLIRIGPGKFNGIKVKINSIGQIEIKND